jgi:hypothetical protein
VTNISGGKLGSISDMLRAANHAGVTVCNRHRESGLPKCLPLPWRPTFFFLLLAGSVYRGCRELSFKQVADTASNSRIKVPVGCAVGAMHPAPTPALPSGTDARKAAVTLTCVVAAMPTGILLRHFRPIACRWSVEHTSAAFWPVQPCPMHSAAQRGASGRRGGRESAAGGGL